MLNIMFFKMFGIKIKDRNIGGFTIYNDGAENRRGRKKNLEII
jgi:hypothetical protein